MAFYPPQRDLQTSCRLHTKKSLHIFAMSEYNSLNAVKSIKRYEMDKTQRILEGLMAAAILTLPSVKSKPIFFT